MKQIPFFCMLVLALTHSKIIDIDHLDKISVQKNPNSKSNFLQSGSSKDKSQQDTKVDNLQELQQDDIITDDGDPYQDDFQQEEDDGQQVPQTTPEETSREQIQPQEQQSYNRENQDENSDDLYEQEDGQSVTEYDQQQQYLRDFGDDQYEEEYGGQFQNEEEKTYRISVYQRNQQQIQEHNRDPTATYTRGNTGLMFQDPNQFITSALMDLPQQPPGNGVFVEAPKNFRAKYVDWREHMTQVRDQKRRCNSCYAFAVASLMQAYYSMKEGELVNFSEQQLVDCCKEQCYGCVGGYPYAAIQYLSVDGIQTLENYPYKEVVQKCKIKSTSNTIKLISTEEPYNSVYGVQNLKFALTKGPISVIIDMRRWDPLYSGGIISRCPERLSYNHAILLAGIREEDDAWLIRNSWGSGWGYDGYGYVLAGNTCGIADKGVLPIVPGASPMDSSYQNQQQQYIPQDQYQNSDQQQYQQYQQDQENQNSQGQTNQQVFVQAFDQNQNQEQNYDQGQNQNIYYNEPQIQNQYYNSFQNQNNNRLTNNNNYNQDLSTDQEMQGGFVENLNNGKSNINYNFQTQYQIQGQGGGQFQMQTQNQEQRQVEDQRQAQTQTQNQRTPYINNNYFANNFSSPKFRSSNSNSNPYTPTNSFVPTNFQTPTNSFIPAPGPTTNNNSNQNNLNNFQGGIRRNGI